MFCIIEPNDPDHANHLAQMHNLRYRIFYENLGWRNGLKIFSQMEFDQYDHSDTKYLVRINSQDCVDACARLTHTNYPYLLGHTFAHSVEQIEIPEVETVVEISRLCADPATTPRNITGQLMYALLEYALDNDVTQYVSLSDVKIIPVVRRFGWASTELGARFDTGTEISVALSYDVNEQFCDNVKRIVGAPEEQYAFLLNKPVYMPVPVLLH